MLRQMAREAHELPDEIQQAPDHRALGIQPRFQHTAVIDAATVPPLHRLGEPINLQATQAQRLADIA
jgi:hypothetical protein